MLSTALAMTPDFKAMVMESVRRSAAEGRLPARGEALLIGQADAGGLIKVRISRRYRWFDAYMVRGLIQLKALDRLGILIGDDFDKNMPGRGLLALVDREGIVDEGAGADPRLARLAHAARGAWSTAS